MEGNTPVQSGLGYGTHTSEPQPQPGSSNSKGFSVHVTLDKNVKPLTHNPDIDELHGGAQSISTQTSARERKISPLPTQMVLNQHSSMALKQNGVIFSWLEPSDEGWQMNIDSETSRLAENVRIRKLEGKTVVEFEADGRLQAYEFTPVIPSYKYKIATSPQPGE